MMQNNFITRDLFTKDSTGALNETRLQISKPFSMDADRVVCAVEFSNVSKYDTIIKGLDELHAIECALTYIASICKNSEEPEFFINKSESMRYTSF